ncbi:MAG TPA: hypothetical protein VHG10_13845 [Glycomyces sp.]|nr:hypothetical protein [Glycomyces sp.]
MAVAAKNEAMTIDAGLAYKGRPYAKPDEELVDQGLLFDIGTILSRRGVPFASAGLAVAGRAACNDDSDGSSSATDAATDSTASGDLTEIPEETAGPYPGDGSNGADVLEQSGVVRGDIRSSFGAGRATAEGVGVDSSTEAGGGVSAPSGGGAPSDGEMPSGDS